MASLIIVAVLLPVTYLIIRAVGAGGDAWQGLLRFQTFETIARTAWLSTAVTVASAIIAVPLAWLTVRTDLPLRRMWAVLTPLPLVIPSYVGAYLFASAFGPRGLLQQLLESIFQVTRLPEIYGFPGAMMVLTLLSYPYILIGTRAALSKIDPGLEEASRSLGYGAWDTLWRVTLPLLRPALGAGCLLVALYVLRDFGAVAIMRYSTFTRAIYASYTSFDRSQAALLSLVLVAITLFFLALETRTLSRAQYFQSGTGKIRPPTLVHLGYWRWPALFFCGAVVFVSLILPAGLLTYWLVRGLGAGEIIPTLGLAAWNSVITSGLGALATLLAALPVAILIVRRPSRMTRLLHRLTYSTFALPGIVIALALVFFGANHAPLFYQTLPMLLLAYGILFLPQAIGAVRASLLQIHPNLEEAARSLGRHPIQVFFDITFPLLRSGLVAGASLVFLTIMKELPATLILAPIGFKTLATGVWSAVSEAFFAQAAVPALLIVLMSSLPMTFFILNEQSVEPS
jgi:iron(III) transport system permease protein